MFGAGSETTEWGIASDGESAMSSPKRILVPVDFSDHSQFLIDHACGLAEQTKSELHVLHVQPMHKATESNGVDARGALEQLGSLVRPADELELQTTKRVLQGLPHRAIVDYAQDQNVELIVMGTHGRRGLSHFALGSVAERVLRSAPCPVQVVRTSQSTAQQLEQAAAALTEVFGDSLAGPIVETEQRICSAISDRLQVSSTQATQLFDQLKLREWAVNQSAKSDQAEWTFVTGVEFVDGEIDFRPADQQSPAAELVARARQLRATDIHLDPCGQEEYRVRLRIDGQLEEYCRLNRDIADHVCNQWKMMAGLDIAEPFQPKEGRVAFPASADGLRELEARLTTAPVADGEAATMRLFSSENVYIPILELGFGKPAQAAVDDMLSRNEGLVLVTGPTGSGKTTTVYSMLETISSSGKNIVSIEDPVEFNVPFVRQMEVDLRHNITMTGGLRTMLRMDPDVVFVGEIRDALAAEIAMRAASAGRYVFSTLHTRDVASVVTALRDLGLPDRSLAANISGIVNQRLVRRLCTQCRESVAFTPVMKSMCEQYSLSVPESIYEAKGCLKCRGTGYWGRVGVFEAVALTSELREVIVSGVDEAGLRHALIDSGMVTLDADAVTKVIAGITDVHEVQRVHWLL